MTNLKKRALALITAVMMIIYVLPVSILAVDESTGEIFESNSCSHEHVWVEIVFTEAMCTQDGTKSYEFSCGATEIDDEDVPTVSGNDVVNRDDTVVQETNQYGKKEIEDEETPLAADPICTTGSIVIGIIVTAAVSAVAVKLGAGLAAAATGSAGNSDITAVGLLIRTDDEEENIVTSGKSGTIIAAIKKFFTG